MIKKHWMMFLFLLFITSCDPPDDSPKNIELTGIECQLTPQKEKVVSLNTPKTLSGRKSSILQSTSHSIHLGFADKMTSVGDIKNLQIVKKASILGCTSRANAL